MPGIDIYSLGNYRLDGAVSASIQDVTPAIDNVLTSISRLQTGIAYTIATFPAGTKLISINPTIVSAKMGYKINTEGPASIYLALVDAASVVWQLAPKTTNLTGVSLMSVRIANPSTESMYFIGDRQVGITTTPWTPIVYAKPTAFNMDTAMSLCVYVDSNNSPSASNLYVDVKNFRIVAL
ncbi:hypothetical protein MKX75_06105 [Paenibacillus sp. FSL R5-0341]|uniref:hypothetical protein n=1 Tax=Paenibacillus sp. FSL R5-0341 TaxID=2921636 RepID=UPI0030CF6053